MGRVAVFGYKVASQQSWNEQTLCLVEDKSLNHFKNILKKKEKFNQLWTDL